MDCLFRALVLFIALR